MKRSNLGPSGEESARPLFCSLQPLILASESPRRSRLLRSLGVTIEVIPSGIDEKDDPQQEPGPFVISRAREKAQAVARCFPHSWVLGADTVVALHETLFGKPETAEQAIAMLRQLSGQAHDVFSGLCLMRLDPPFERAVAVRTEVRFKPLSDAEIRAYVATGEPLDKAGAYGIQGKGAFLVEAVHGSYTNVVGLPLCETLEWLQELRIVAPAEAQ